MAFGDLGGVVTELVITCKTPESGAVNIKKGDPVRLCGNYTVTNEPVEENDEDDSWLSVFGQALSDANTNGTAIPIKVRGICEFPYEGEDVFEPETDGSCGVSMGESKGKVRASYGDRSVIVKVDTVAKRLHVLI